MADLDQAVNQFRRDDEEQFVKTQAEQAGLEYINLVGYPILGSTLTLIPLEDCIRLGVIAYLKVTKRLRVAITQITPEVTAYLQQFSDTQGFEIHISLCSQSSLNFAIQRYVIEEQKVTKDTKIEVSKEEQRKALKAINSIEELTESLSEANATQVLDLLFAAGTGMEASDIHLEPQETNIRVRFRIDGVLQDITTLSPSVYKQTVSRVKFLAKMKLDVRNVNQDGRFSIDLAETTLDVRVATLPSTYGEVINMRLLRAHAQFIKLDELGFAPTTLAMIKEAIALPHGMILVTGPTGSGKTTTLYAILDYVNKPGIKIITLEDPIEYRLQGIDQVQISHEEKGMDFAEALKASLRQDPDILMVGEIRDKDTADVGLQAAMTGHLFLSTLHTNNAPASLARLIDMGVEPYKIAGAINLIIAQRLVRKLCTNCQGQGCDQCHKTGYKGRMPILEVLKPSKALDDAIVQKRSVRDLYQLAITNGMIPMRDDGMQKVTQGLTTQAEVDRVTAELTEDELPTPQPVT